MDFLELLLHLEINIISLIILFLIYGNVRHKPEQRAFDRKLFMIIMLLTGIILTADSLMWILDGEIFFMSLVLYRSVTVLYYVLQPVICMLWVIYVDYAVNHDRAALRRRLPVILVPSAVNAVIAIFSIWYPFYFYFDQNQIYHRGDLFIVASVLCFIYPVYSFFYVLIHKKRIYRKFYHSFLVYVFPPFLGAILQIAVYGLSLIWIGMTLSILIVFIYYQNEQMNMDYLTGLFNRRQLDYYLQDLINKDGERFGCLMMDLNSFKTINDRYGHKVGDEALQRAAEILRKTFGTDAFVARYGGDEFVVILEGEAMERIEDFVKKLHLEADRLNGLDKQTYRLEFSVGADFYHRGGNQTPHEFLNHIDALMYENKRKAVRQ